MSITFSARHFDATEKLQTFATREMHKLKRYMNGEVNGEIVLEESGNRKIVDMRLQAFGKLLPVRLEGPDFYKVIPKAVDKLKQQLKSHKAKVFKI